MDGNSWFCSTCQSTQASAFCLCRNTETFLCDRCLPEHFSKNLGWMHFAHPIALFKKREIPGFFERLQKRFLDVPKACDMLKGNLSAVDRSIRELEQKGEGLILSIKEYVFQETTRLLSLRAELEASINASVAEVMQTMEDDFPVFTSRFGRLLRSGTDPCFLNIFSCQITSSHSHEPLKARYTIDDCPIMPSVSQNVLTRHQLLTGQTMSSILPVTFTEGAVFCLLDPNTLFCTGGNPELTTTYLLSLSQGSLAEQPGMLTPRRYPGIAQCGGFVYIFGGYDGVQDTTSCEKFKISEKVWSRLPNMSKYRCGFAPCVLGDDIYLTDPARRHKTLEIFNVHTETFRESPVRIPSMISDNSVAFIADEVLTVITCSKQMGRLRLGGGTVFEESVVGMQNGSSGMSNIPPKKVGRMVYWVDFRLGKLVKFDLDRKTIAD